MPHPALQGCLRRVAATVVRQLLAPTSPARPARRLQSDTRSPLDEPNKAAPSVYSAHDDNQSRGELPAWTRPVSSSSRPSLRARLRLTRVQAERLRLDSLFLLRMAQNQECACAGARLLFVRFSYGLLLMKWIECHRLLHLRDLLLDQVSATFPELNFRDAKAAHMHALRCDRPPAVIYTPPHPCSCQISLAPLLSGLLRTTPPCPTSSL